MWYFELRSRSNFSFLSGASHPEELVDEAKKQGYEGLALTDECSLAGVVRAHRRLRSRVCICWWVVSSAVLMDYE